MNFYRVTLCPNISGQLSLYKYVVITVFIGLEFVSVFGMNGAVAFCINDGRFKYACANDFSFRATC